MWKTFTIVLIAMIMCFSVYAYKLQTSYNTEDLEMEKKKLQQDVATLTYALSIVPKEVKNEVFFNSVKEKFPSVEERTDFIDVIRVKKPDKEADKKVAKKMDKDDHTIASLFNEIVPKDGE